MFIIFCHVDTTSCAIFYKLIILKGNGTVKKGAIAHACCRCFERLLCWAKECRPQGVWYPPHTDSEPHIEPGIPSFPLDLLGLPSKWDKKKKKTEDERQVMTVRQARLDTEKRQGSKRQEKGKTQEQDWERWEEWERERMSSTSSVSNMVRLEEKGELFFSLSSQGFSTDTKPSPKSLFKPTPTPPWSSESAAPLTCTTILQEMEKKRQNKL